MSVLRVLSRPLMALPVVLSGFEAVARPANHRERAAVFSPLAEKLGFEIDERRSDRTTRALGASMAIAGFALIFGKMPRTASFLLAVLQIPVAVANNAFWTHSGEERRADIAGLLTSCGAVGGFLAAAADTGGKPSLAWRREQARKNSEKMRAVRAS